jgi:hypothetical protein
MEYGVASRGQLVPKKGVPLKNYTAEKGNYFLLSFEGIAGYACLEFRIDDHILEIDDPRGWDSTAARPLCPGLKYSPVRILNPRNVRVREYSLEGKEF